MENIKSIGRDTHIFLCVMAVIMVSVVVNILIRSGYEMNGFVVGQENYEIMNSADFFEVAFITLFTRSRQLLFAYVLYRLFNQEIAYNIIIMLSSAVVGGLLCIQTFYEGFVGVFELILFLFPHYIFYFFLIRTLYIQFKRNNKIGRKGGFVVLLLFIAGVLSELLFSKFFLNEFYQYIV